MDSVFGLLDRKQTIKNAKQFLYEYRDWQLEAARFSFSLQSPMMDGMPKAQSDPRHTRMFWIPGSHLHSGRFQPWVGQTILTT